MDIINKNGYNINNIFSNMSGQLSKMPISVLLTEIICPKATKSMTVAM
jgi:hypothetical protein